MGILDILGKIVLFGISLAAVLLVLSKIYHSYQQKMKGKNKY
jgi:hypothetical protein